MARVQTDQPALVWWQLYRYALAALAFVPLVGAPKPALPAFNQQWELPGGPSSHSLPSHQRQLAISHRRSARTASRS